MNQAILYPVFVQVLLTLAVYCLLSLARFRAIAAAGRPPGKGDIAMGRYPWPDDAVKRANNQRNQFELPVLFYALVAFLLITAKADLVQVVLAWIFVLSRILHTLVHLGSNIVLRRGLAFLVGIVVLLVMWIWFGLRLFLLG